MIAVDTTSPPQAPAADEQSYRRAQPAEDTARTPYDRMLAGFSHHMLHSPLRAYQRLVSATILAFVFLGYSTTFTVTMARRLGKNELSAHLEAGLLARLTPDHSLIRTQYLLLPLSAAGAFFTPQQRALLRGDHPRQPTPALSSSLPRPTPLPLVVGGSPH